MDPTLLDSLSGQVALVTGANRGLGAAIADGLRGLGATVYAGTRRLDAVEPADRHRPVAIDVTDDGSIEAAVDRIEAEAGRLDVLVNNAGVGPADGRTLLDEPVERIDTTLAVNLRGPIVLTRAALPLLRSRAGARVVNVSSGLGALSAGMGGGMGAYRISKTGLNGLTAALHGEFGPDLIANSASPGWVRTDMGGPAAPRSVETGADTPIWLCRFAPGAPGGRFWHDRTAVEW